MASVVCTAFPAAALVGRQRAFSSQKHTSRQRSSANRRRHSHFICSCHSAIGNAAQPTPEGSDHLQDVDNNKVPPASVNDTQQPSNSIGSRIKRFFGGDKMDMQRLKALGLGAVASYGFVSNVTYGTGLAVSWVAFVRQTGDLCYALYSS